MRYQVMISFMEFVHKTSREIQPSAKDTGIRNERVYEALTAVDKHLFTLDYVLPAMLADNIPGCKKIESNTIAELMSIEKFIRWQLQFLVQQNLQHKIIPPLYYALYKIALGNIRRQSNLEKCFDKCFSGPKTLHFVQVLDGEGDLLHFFDWFSAYCKNRSVDNTTVIISFVAANNAEQNIRVRIANLLDGHPLKSHQDLIICGDSDLGHNIESKILSPIVNRQTDQTYSAIYGISTDGDARAIQVVRSLSQFGIPCCSISEMSIFPTPEIMIPKKISKFSFGIWRDNYGKCAPAIGCFFPEFNFDTSLESVISNISQMLLCKLLGDNAQELSIAEKIQALNNMQIIAGYYQAGRDHKSLMTFIKRISSPDKKVILFLTGTDTVPKELTTYKEGSHRLNMVCAKLNSYDHNSLLLLLSKNTDHAYFCTGDKTFEISLAINKFPFFLHKENPKKNPAKENALHAFNDYFKTMGRENTHEDVQGYINELSSFYIDLKSKKPSKEALEFFAQHLAPYIRDQFNLAKHLNKLILLVENKAHDVANKFSLPSKTFENFNNVRELQLVMYNNFKITHFDKDEQTQDCEPSVRRSPYL